MILRCYLILLSVVIVCNGQYGQINIGNIATAYLDASIDNLKPVFEQYASNSPGRYNSTKCFDQFKYFKAEVERSEIWALKVIDSWSKPPAGIASLNIQDLGNFDQCLAIEKDSQESHIGKWKAQYCLTPIQPIISDENIIIKTLNNDGNSSLNKDTLNFLPTIMLAICIPDTCSPDLWVAIVDKLLEPVLFKSGPYINMLCQVADKPPMDILDKIAV